MRNIEKGGKHTNQLNKGPEIKLHMGSRTQGRSKISSLLRMDPPIMEKLDILKINKGGNNVSMTPYTQT